MKDNLYRILIKGGITSPGELKNSIAMLEAVGLKEVHFGSRQDLLFPLKNLNEQQLDDLAKFNTQIVEDRDYQNIVCSYVSADIFDMTHWLKGSTYLYILERFDYVPKLKINITDPKQRLVPLFSGNLNFIASENEDYWHLYIKLPHWKKGAYYPVLVYSWDLTSISKAIENIHEEIDEIEELFFILNKQLDTNNKTIEKELELPYLTFPYYEGMNRMGTDNYWLGLYWRNNKYDLDFLKALCGFCLDNSIGKICITPWKSFVIKGIKRDSRPELERFLGKKGINVRHSQLEMNWHLPVDDLEALELKKSLVRSFDKSDISTYGLTFGISNSPGKRSYFTTIVIEKNATPSVMEKFEVRPTFTILYSLNFDPNTQTYLNYAQDIDKAELPGLLMELSKKYFEEQTTEKPSIANTKKEKTITFKNVFQCPSCHTVYDKNYGDEKNGIAVGTSFTKLPDTYCCPVCEAPKTEFTKTKLPILDTV